MTCNEINNLLPAYLEDVLSLEEKKPIESHLASCTLCSRDLADMKKVENLVKGLGEVEPPPFFEQRIMAQVREEAGQKKGLLRKFFYPLHIKIPIQALATVLIAVLAFHVYQKSGPEMKHTAPIPMPLSELGKGQITVNSPVAPTVPSVISPARRAPAGNPPDKEQQQFAAAPPSENIRKADRVADLPAPEQEELPSAITPAAPFTVAKEKEVPQARAEALIKAQDRAEKQEAGKVLDALPLEQKRKGRMAETGALAEEDKMMKSAPAVSRLMAAPAKKRSAIDLTIQVRDTDVAVREIEERLGQAGARITERQHRERGEFLKAEIAASKVTAFLDRLKEVGKINLDKNTLDVPDELVTVSIKIVKHPR